MEDIIKKYLEGESLKCPYCDSYNLWPTHKDAFGHLGEIYLSEQCRSCGKCWTITYKLISIDE